ncbi:MAG TPA: hypothetical protein VHF06_14675 [Pseudonocardiaceae bacterium]|jgi:putative flavoprotein involved in K+ transport|nr:hypothetical protein [Pseudonocardiaceae bacterium]
MVRDEIVDHLAAYARSFGPPVVEGIAVTRLRADNLGRFVVDTTGGRSP